ncbi:hypothetical protein, partial [Xenorhabdus santafensis]|uniref:hypothetical protein n=1 Tax=Xenorhabdus santafensis TaxID=2582833 RepID=UPI0029E818A2
MTVLIVERLNRDAAVLFHPVINVDEFKTVVVLRGVVVEVNRVDVVIDGFIVEPVGLIICYVIL